MTHASVFSGIGGPEVAAAMLGWRNVFHCEINQFGRKVLEYWFPESDSYADITKTDFKRYRGKVDVLTGGFPCQPFSYAGKRGGQADDRYLWPEMLRVIDEVRPTWVVGENVAGITTMVESCEITDMGGETSLFEEDNGVHRFRAEYAFTIERICRDLESKGYTVQPMLIPACAVGAPHRRDRVFIIAHTSSCGSESYPQDGRTESDRSDKLSQPGKWREQAKLDNGFSTFPRLAGDTECPRLEHSLDRAAEAEVSYEKNERGKVCLSEQSGFFEAESSRRSSSYSDSSRGRKMDKHLQSAFTDGTESLCHGRIRDVARMSPGERWEGFPTVSPVHRGNDGFPFDVDDLSIPFSKWRKESLKAYGNAIVPQVMYRIFQCIEKVNENQ